MKTSNLLILLGVLLSLTLIISGVLDAKRANFPFEVAAASYQANMGLSPIILSEGDLSHPLAAPGISPPITESAKNISASAASQGLTAGSGVSSQMTTPLTTLYPDRIFIPAIKLDAPVVSARLRAIEYEGQTYQQWVAPNSSAAGLLSTSAVLGVAGNTVLIGHHNIYGEVFGHLVDLQVGDQILLFSEEKEFAYTISLKMILPERWQPIDVRTKNSEWMAPSEDERLTLVTCWPYQSDTHRLIIVAIPVDLSAVKNIKIIPRLTPHPTVTPIVTPTITSGG